MTQYQPIKRLLIANRGEDNRGADQRLASLNVFMNECDFIHQEQT